MQGSYLAEAGGGRGFVVVDIHKGAGGKDDVKRCRSRLMAAGGEREPLIYSGGASRVTPSLSDRPAACWFSRRILQALSGMPGKFTEILRRAQMEEWSANKEAAGVRPWDRRGLRRLTLSQVGIACEVSSCFGSSAVWRMTLQLTGTD